MHKLLLDTNVLLDFMVAERPGSDAAVEVIRRCATKEDVGYVCAGSLKDTYYVARKYLGEQSARDFVRAFLMVLEVCALDGPVCRIAADSNEPDFEDALIRASAEDERVDFILTRDVGAFQATKIRSLDAERYLALFARESRG